LCVIFAYKVNLVLLVHLLSSSVMRAIVIADCDSVVAIPVYLRHSILIREGSAGKLDITVGPKQTMGKTVRTFCAFCQTTAGRLC